MKKGLPIAALYLFAVVAVANLAFGAEFSSAGPFARPVGTTAYGATITPAAPVDPNQVAWVIADANGGPPTVGQPRPAQSQSSTSTSDFANSDGRARRLDPNRRPHETHAAGRSRTVSIEGRLMRRQT